MATTRKKARQRISYVLPLADSTGSTGGHRLGVNSVAIDKNQSILYSAGRDGSLCAWDLNFPLSADDLVKNGQSKEVGRSTARTQVQAHTHWVNDITLVHNNSALVSASSDCSVKVWRPHSQETEAQIPTTIGLHTDYVKCVGSPGPSLDWVASGGLDHQIRVWDINGHGEKLAIDALEKEMDNAKGSVYALQIAGGIMASGGPEGVVRVWDYRSGRRITKFVGHTDKINSILVNDLGDTVMTASSDRTIKVWSMAAGRCMHTLTMHNDSVWSLSSDHPDLAIFYSSDRSGLIAKTDARYSPSLDEALSVVVAKEHEGVSKLAVAGDYIWTATASSSINRWLDVSTDVDNLATEHPRRERQGSLAMRTRGLSDAPSFHFDELPKGVPPESVLRTTDAARYTATISKFKDLEGANAKSSLTGRKGSEMFLSLESEEPAKPIREKPEETIEGQNGLTRHALLNDRRRVLTVDTAGEVMLWDLIKCIPVQSYGKRHLDNVLEELNVQESIPNWCSLDTRAGRLAVSLEENYAFEAEIYADELDLENDMNFNDSQRIQYGKWVLRYLFEGLIEEEIKRDLDYREKLYAKQAANGIQRKNALRLVDLPKTTISSWSPNQDDDDPAITPRPSKTSVPPITPGFAIAAATPGLPSASPGVQSPPLGGKTPGTDLEKRMSRTSGDYFSRLPIAPTSSTQALTSRGKEGDDAQETTAQAPQSPGEEKKGGFFSSKNLRMKFPKKLGKTASDATKTSEDKGSESDKISVKEKDEINFDDSFFGTVQSIRHAYDEQLAADPTSNIQPGIMVSSPQETPVLKLPSYIPVVVQEERTDSGGVVDLYRGTVGTVGRDADLLEKVAPQWLGDLLLKNTLPTRDINRLKQPFVLEPLDKQLPNMSNAEGNARLTAPRVLRARKVLEYVAERLNPPEKPLAPDAPKPEEYLELYCAGELVPLNMTLATLQRYVWKKGGDIELYYKSNGKWPELEKHYGIAPHENGSAGSTNGERNTVNGNITPH